MKKFLICALLLLCFPLAVLTAGLAMKKWRDYYAA